MRRSRPKGLISLETSQEQMLATVKPLALKNEPGSPETSKMIKYESLNFPNLLQPNAATEFCDHSKASVNLNLNLNLLLNRLRLPPDPRSIPHAIGLVSYCG
jgi:hypothetical protein